MKRQEGVFALGFEFRQWLEKQGAAETRFFPNEQKLALPFDVFLKTARREEGGGEVLDEFGDHCGGHPKTDGRTSMGGAVFF